MAAAESPGKRLREEATCSICLDFFTDPVTLDCGHNFCQACIESCWRNSPTGATCPQCRGRVRQRSLKPNRQLANAVEIAKELIMQEKVEAERDKTVVQFKKLHQSLEEQVKLLLARMDKVEKEIARKQEEQLAKISEKLSFVEKRMQKMEEKHQQSGSERWQNLLSFLFVVIMLVLILSCGVFTYTKLGEIQTMLKDKRNILQMHEKKWWDWNFSDINPFLEGFLEQFQGTKEWLQKISHCVLN